jgi:hypothetical protein
MKTRFVLCLASCLLATTAFTQIDDVLGKAGNLFNKGLSTKLRRDPITTSFDDCDKKAILPVAFGKDSVKRPLCKLPFEAGKGYKLQPGFYEANVMSFCLKAGTYAPSKGDGYLYAPLKGPKEELVYKLINNWQTHSEIDQRDLQLILWAIIAKTKISNLSPKLKAVATILLSENDINELSKVGLDMLSEQAMKKAINNLPEPAQKVIELENKMRSKFYQATVSYQEIKSLAMLPGEQIENSSIQRGVWTKLSNGCYIKYLPSGYSLTKIEYYVPNNLNNNEIYYLETGAVAMPASTGSQRLAQSNKLVCVSAE